MCYMATTSDANTPVTRDGHVSLCDTYRPGPADDLELLVQLQHEDDHEDDGKHHLTDGHGGVAGVQRRRIADDDDEADQLETEREEGEIQFSATLQKQWELWRKKKTLQK